MHHRARMWTWVSCAEPGLRNDHHGGLSMVRRCFASFDVLLSREGDALGCTLTWSVPLAHKVSSRFLYPRSRKISLRNSVIAVRGPSAGSPIACTRALHRWRYHSRNSHVGRSYFLALLEGDTQYINRGKHRLFCRVRFVVEKRCRQHS